MPDELMGMDLGINLLIVDDNSPDGTGEIADRLAEEFSQIRVEHRESKQGLGTAYRHGFEIALGMGADCVFEMDADFSHSPQYIPEFLSAIKEHDVVHGSRYVKGGGTRNWGPMRKIISKGGSFYTRALTGLKIKDVTGGFRCFRAEVLRQIDFSRIKASGYGFQVELAYVCSIMGFDIYELPIIFVDRRVGESKMSMGIVFEAVRLVAGLRRKYRDITKG
ncbi:MAG: dolichyl-phosphate beta-D-mannosyltransferase [Candidatus Anoxymicrobium japonicum]|uniref:Dolichyl-phosphate beta-D-mannosyltransferase n=1 Tax=Candidatus Anoxymicrobium japonicum TaxID=2013648 RepID=A0A2N3G4U0_9ACTN|nr:MAG: dolichyl-phosphate beta-D-mannosyltransferase [Candidatus Anoxymicrobium japonicum]